MKESVLVSAALIACPITQRWKKKTKTKRAHLAHEGLHVLDSSIRPGLQLGDPALHGCWVVSRLDRHLPAELLNHSQAWFDVFDRDADPHAGNVGEERKERSDGDDGAIETLSLGIDQSEIADLGRGADLDSTAGVGGKDLVGGEIAL